MDKEHIREVLSRLVFKSVHDTGSDNGSLVSKLVDGDKKLTIKLGFDPTAPDLHLGHAIPLTVLTLLQSLGHTIHVIIGDFTAQIGDPTGKNTTRPPLSPEMIRDNAKTYTEQLGKFVDLNKTKVSFNSEWLDKLGTAGMIKLSSHTTVARMLERDDFGKRFNSQIGIGLHEFLYPLLQGYDSVAIGSDLELGGTDQEFNLHMGRNLQKDFGQAPQTLVMTPILEGLDGRNKMSKSLNNFIAVTENPVDMFGKVMKLGDDMIIKYFQLLSFKRNSEIAEIESKMASGANPMEFKLDLAQLIVGRFWDEDEALRQREGFVNRFRNKAEVTDMETFEVKTGLKLSQVLKDIGFAPSTSQAMKLIQAGAVYIDGVKTLTNVEDLPDSFVLKAGKLKIGKVVVAPELTESLAM